MLWPVRGLKSIGKSFAVFLSVITLGLLQVSCKEFFEWFFIGFREEFISILFVNFYRDLWRFFFIPDCTLETWKSCRKSPQYSIIHTYFMSFFRSIIKYTYINKQMVSTWIFHGFHKNIHLWLLLTLFSDCF